MKNMLRAFSVLLCIAVLLAVFASCHGRLVRPEDEETTQIKDDFKIEIYRTHIIIHFTGED